MQFTTIIAPVLALAAAASAQYNGTAMAPTGTAVGTASASVSGAGGSQSTGGSAPIDNAAAANSFASSALGLVIAGGVALAL